MAIRLPERNASISVQVTQVEGIFAIHQDAHQIYVLKNLLKLVPQRVGIYSLF